MPTKLGQNFLKDPAILEKIIQSSDITDINFVLEIGPGKGVLTEKLAELGKKIIAVELDDALIPYLKHKFSPNKNVEIIHEDILRTNLPALIEKYATRMQDSSCKSGIQYKVVANIPYYITSPIIRLFLEQLIQPKEMILMIQKEVAQRIVAAKGQMSILAVSVGYYASAEILFDVDKNAFSPVPKVDSSVIKIVPQKKFNKEEDKKFFRIVKAGFCSKRKTLLNNLSTSLKIKKETIEEILSLVSLDKNVRAQELTVNNWKRLFDHISK
ncbi:MAG TPA: ribosomal RNA small subunit methyltransferase A [Candidatus Moranbacteria bacterium]|nr:ribosomal RNA small subunit methyltransferase A [Candidatus Moranbacteria bacterium]